MQDYIRNTSRIAKNTLMLYGRMLFSLIISLYTSRLILQALGVEDYGIYNVVGGFVSMFSLFSSSLSEAVRRFLTFELGHNDVERLKAVFSTSLLIHFLLALIIALVAETFGVWFLNNKMVVPPNRLYAASLVFHTSVISFVLNLLMVPFNATIIAHERMQAFAYIGILEVSLKLCAVLFVNHLKTECDGLILYAALILCANIFLQLIYFIYCRKNFIECSAKPNINGTVFNEIASFAGWNFIGCTAGLMKDQGVNILLNASFGPIVNAARGIANQVNGLAYSFANNFMTALNPQITKSYASGDRDYMLSIVQRGTRFSCYIILIIAIPVILETRFILSFWLGDYPEHTVNFIRLVLALTLVDMLSNTLITLVNATGKIKWYQITVGGILLLNFPATYLFLKLGCPPECVYIVAITISLCCFFIRLSFLKYLVDFPVFDYVRNVCINVGIVCAVSLLIPTFLHRSMDYGLLRFVVVGVVSACCSVFSILFIGSNKNERTFIIKKICAVIKNESDKN